MLFDTDFVKIQNLTRSPIFLAEDCGRDEENKTRKVESTARFLNDAGIAGVTAVPMALHESELWTKRESGTPDLVISAANEHDVRYHIEMGYPPLQIYATTARNWQVALLRHEPGASSCSLCRFPPEGSQLPMASATANTTPAP